MISQQVTYIGRFAADLFFNCVQHGNPARRLANGWRRMRFRQFIEFATHMRPAGRLRSLGVVQLVVAGEAICVDDAGEVPDMLLYMLATTIRVNAIHNAGDWPSAPIRLA